MRECLALARTRHHLPDDALTYRESLVAGAPPRVLGDEDELKAVVSNLVDNAIKYSGPQVQVAVELEQTERRRRATLRVRDQGVGISPAELKRIFKRFYRVPGPWRRASRAPAWACSSSDRSIARHGGRVFAESEGPGRGSTFTVQLPLVRAAMSRILVVEDEQHLADGLRFNLEAERHDVDVVGHGRGRRCARLAADPTRYDLVILDVMLPGIDGFDVVAELRRDAAGSCRC